MDPGGMLFADYMVDCSTFVYACTLSFSQAPKTPKPWFAVVAWSGILHLLETEVVLRVEVLALPDALSATMFQLILFHQFSR